MCACLVCLAWLGKTQRVLASQPDVMNTRTELNTELNESNWTGGYTHKQGKSECARYGIEPASSSSRMRTEQLEQLSTQVNCLLSWSSSSSSSFNGVWTMHEQQCTIAMHSIQNPIEIESNRAQRTQEPNDGERESWPVISMDQHDDDEDYETIINLFD